MRMLYYHQLININDNFFQFKNYLTIYLIFYQSNKKKI